MRNLTLAFDVDGVIYQWEPQTRLILKQNYGFDLKESTSWGSIKEQLPPQVWKHLWDTHKRAMFLGGQYYPGAKEVMGRLAADHSIVLVSATPKEIRTDRAHQLLNDLRMVSGVVFVEPESRDKSIVKADVYLDDNQPTAVNSSINGVSLLFNRPWNINEWVGSLVTRVDSWEEVEEKVREVANA